MLTTNFCCVALELVLLLSIFFFEAESRAATLEEGRDEGASPIHDDIHWRRQNHFGTVSPDSNRVVTKTEDMAELQAEALMAKLFQDSEWFPELVSAEQIKAGMEIPTCFDGSFDAQPFVRFSPEVEVKSSGQAGFQKHSNGPKWIPTSSGDSIESDAVIVELLDNGNLADIFEPVQGQFETKLGPSRPLINKKRANRANTHSDREAMIEQELSLLEQNLLRFSLLDFEGKLAGRNGVTDLADKTLLRNQHTVANVEPYWNKDGGTITVELQEFVRPQSKDTDSVHEEKPSCRHGAGNFVDWNLLLGRSAPNSAPVRDTDEDPSELELEDLIWQDDKQADRNRAGIVPDWPLLRRRATPNLEPAQDNDNDEGPFELELDDFIRREDERTDRNGAGSVAHTTAKLELAAAPSAKAGHQLFKATGPTAVSVSPELFNDMLGIYFFTCITLSILYLCWSLMKISGSSWWLFAVRRPAVLQEDAAGSGKDNRAFKINEIV